MDAVSDPLVREVVVESSAQVGKTEILLNVLGYHIQHDPAPVLAIEPTVELAQGFSKDRLDPMIRDTPALRSLVREAKSRDKGNTIMHKRFPGGHVTMIGANSPVGLASRPIRVLLVDEVDKYPESAGESGDPVSLARKRTQTFQGIAKIVMTSTPLLAGTSRIEQAYLASDQRRYFVPCPECGTFQTLKWAQVHFDRDDKKRVIRGSARYTCENPACGAMIPERQKAGMLARGEWRATAEGEPGVVGFHLSELYSTFSTWESVARQHQAALGDRDRMQQWTNECLGETFEDEAQRIDSAALFMRREEYPAPVPAAGLVLVAGCDVQQDRVEVDVRAWGRGLENWGVEYRVIYGDTTKTAVYDQLAEYLAGTWRHESGAELHVTAACIDAGFNSMAVYAFCKTHAARRWWACKGDKGEEGAPMFKISRPRPGKNRRPVDLMLVGTDIAKATLHSMLGLREPAAGYCHYPVGECYDQEYFEQLGAEDLRYTRRMGRRYRVWHQTRPRNEALDTFVYGLACIHRLNPVWSALEKRLHPPEKRADEDAPAPARRRRKSRHTAWGGGF